MAARVSRSLAAVTVRSMLAVATSGPSFSGGQISHPMTRPHSAARRYRSNASSSDRCLDGELVAQLGVEPHLVVVHDGRGVGRGQHRLEHQPGREVPAGAGPVGEVDHHAVRSRGDALAAALGGCDVHGVDDHARMSHAEDRAEQLGRELVDRGREHGAGRGGHGARYLR